MLDMKQGEIDAFFGLWLAIVIGGGGYAFLVVMT